MAKSTIKIPELSLDTPNLIHDNPRFERALELLEAGESSFDVIEEWMSHIQNPGREILWLEILNIQNKIHEARVNLSILWYQAMDASRLEKAKG